MDTSRTNVPWSDRIDSHGASGCQPEPDFSPFPIKTDAQLKSVLDTFTNIDHITFLLNLSVQRFEDIIEKGRNDPDKACDAEFEISVQKALFRKISLLKGAPGFPKATSGHPDCFLSSGQAANFKTLPENTPMDVNSLLTQIKRKRPTIDINSESLDVDGFNPPRKTCPQPNVTETTTISMSNSFEVLRTDETPEDPMEGTSFNSTNHPAAQSQTPSSKQGYVDNRKPPPIFISNPEDLSILGKICEVTTDSPTVKSINRKDPISNSFTRLYKILTATPDDYRSVTKMLTNTKVNWHTYALPSEKPIRVVIRGLPDFLTEDEVRSELQKMDFPIESIKQFRKAGTMAPMPLYCLALPRSEEGKKIYSLTKLFFFDVRVEELRKKPGLSQCYNCQQFGHSSTHCHHAKACFKCAGNHEGRDCTKPKSLPGKCANCGGGHIASFRGCPRNPLNLVQVTRPVPQASFQATNSEFPELQSSRTMNPWQNKNQQQWNPQSPEQAQSTQNFTLEGNPADLFSLFTNPKYGEAINIAIKAASTFKTLVDQGEKLTLFLATAQQIWALFN